MNQHVFTEDRGKLEFVGEFDALYRDEEDPWEQSASVISSRMATYYWFSRGRLVEALRHYAFKSALETGCGHGYLSAHIKRHRAIPEVTGMDVVQAAVDKAKRLFPACNFLQGDICSDTFKPPGHYDVVIWGQCLWYLLHCFDLAMDNSLRCVAPGGLFIISQAFLENQKYGTEVVNGFHGALEILSHDVRLSLVEAHYDDTNKHIHHDGLMVFRVK